jgi:hypothetical protein
MKAKRTLDSTIQPFQMQAQVANPAWPIPEALHDRALRVPMRYWAPLAASAMLTAIAGIGVAAKEPLLFASLGPSAYLAARKPQEKSTTFHNVFFGHLIGLGAGFLSVWVLGASHAPVPFLSSYSIAPIRLAVIALAVFLSLFVDALLGIDHTATEATTLLVATGFFRTAMDALVVIQSVAIMAVLSELFRRLRAPDRPIRST